MGTAGTMMVALAIICIFVMLMFVFMIFSNKAANVLPIFLLLSKNLIENGEREIY